MGIVKNLWKGFRGGPDFTETNNFNASFENIQFSVNLPYSNINTIEEPRPIHFPFLKKGWFNEHSKQRRQHHLVHVYTQVWGYVPAVMYLPNGELGVLSLAIQIKRIAKGKNISAFDLDDLGQHLIAEYEEHYNSPIIGGIGGHGLGINTEIRQTVEEESKKRSEPFSEERKAREIELRMNFRGYPPMSPHQIKKIQGRQWVFCTEQQTNTHTKDNMYCIPLSQEYYLCMRFGYRVDIQQKFKVWKDHAEAAEQRIMESVQLTFSQEGLALPSSV